MAQTNVNIRMDSDLKRNAIFAYCFFCENGKSGRHRHAHISAESLELCF